MFGKLADMIKGGVDDLRAQAQKFADKQTAEAVVAVMTGVAFADGEFEPEEKAKFKAALGMNPLLKQFEIGSLLAKHTELVGVYDFDIDMGHEAALKELRDVGSRAPHEKRMLILRLGVAAARADGEIEPEEVAFLRRCAEVLGLSMSEVGLA